MTAQSKWRTHFQENRTLFTLLAVGFFLIELEIFAMAAMKSGPDSLLQVMDHENLVIYESKTARLDPKEKLVFEKTFGPLSNYRVNVVTTQRPFPFRPWFAAAVGLPIGAVLLFGFFIKAYETLFFKEEATRNPLAEDGSTPVDRWDRLLVRISRLNIFALGGFVLLFALGLWAVPQLVAELGRHGADLIARYKWVAMGIAAVFVGFVAWIIFLRYLLARKHIEAQADVEKYRLQLEIMDRQDNGHLLPSPDKPLLVMPQAGIDVKPTQGSKDDRRPS